MKALVVLTAALMMAFTALAGGSSAEANLTVNEAALTALLLPVPETEPERKYLGLTAANAFTLPQVKAETILLEIFSMYCPICQAHAPMLNELYQLIESNAILKEKIKIIGIGTGNTPFEVDVFRKKFNVKFPLLPDDDFGFQNTVTERIRTPTFFVLKPAHGGSTIKVVGIHVGKIENAAVFLKTLTAYENLK